MIRVTPKQRFDCKYAVDSATGCWVWLGCRDGEARLPTDDPRGRYGRFSLDGYRMTQAHRAAYILYVGPIPNGLHVLHRCDNPPCVNPAHLFLGTIKDNSRDMVAKGRGWHQKPNCKSPRLGTGKWPIVNGTPCVPLQCCICGADMFQRVEAYRHGKKPVCSKRCKGVLTSRRCTTARMVPCHECGTLTRKVPAVLKKKSGRVFCSRRCVGLTNARNRWHPT